MSQTTGIADFNISGPDECERSRSASKPFSHFSMIRQTGDFLVEINAFHVAVRSGGGRYVGYLCWQPPPDPLGTAAPIADALPGQSRTAPDPADLRQAETVDKGHGRIETKRILSLVRDFVLGAINRLGQQPKPARGYFAESKAKASQIVTGSR